MTDPTTLSDRQPPSAQRLLELVAGMAGRPVVMVADLVADRFITGTPKRISREAPVLILSFEEERLVPGGGANAVANVAALGGRPRPLGVVGDDASGGELLAELERRGVPVAGIARRAGYRTPTKTRILGGGRHAIKQQIVRYDIEDRLALSDDELARLIAPGLAGSGTDARRSEGGGGPTVAVISDYGYGLAVPAALPLLRRALGGEALILCDSRYRLAEFAGGGGAAGPAGLTGATPNEEEAEALLGRPLGEEPAAVTASADELRRRLGLPFLLITRGSRGMCLVDTGGAAHLPVHGTDQVADVTGAGDTVIGTFALALAAGATPLEAAVLANYAGGVVVMKMGTATLDRDELSQAIAGDPASREEIRWVGC